MEGPPLAGRIRAEVAEEVRDLGGLKLVTVQVGDDPGSTIYLRRKHEAAQETGIESDDRKLPEETSEKDLLALLAELDADEDVDGILVQLPLPEQIDEARVIRAIEPVKDVDGFHPFNAGQLYLGRPTLVPATPLGIMVMLADGLPVMPFAGYAQGYKITPRQLAAAITPKTRLVLLNSPCNPTGAAYTRAELRALGDVLLEYPRVIIGTDDMYEKIYWSSEPFCSLLTAVPELYNRTITINGVSKAYAMTGWRIGYCGGPKEIVTAMSTIHGQSTSNASSISQRAAVAALNGDQECVTKMNEAFKQRHDFVVHAGGGEVEQTGLPRLELPASDLGDRLADAAAGAHHRQAAFPE